MAEDSLYIQTSKNLPKNGEEDSEIELISNNDAQEKLQRTLKLSLVNSDDEEGRETCSYLMKLFTDLDASRPDEKWDIRHKQFISEVQYLQDGRANINLSIEKATIRNKLADEESTRTMVTFIPTEPDDIYKVDITKVAWDFVWGESNTDFEITKHRLQAKVFGTSWWEESLHKEIQVKYTPKMGKDGEIIGEQKVVTKSWLRGRMLDIRNVWVDNVPEFEDADVCFILERGLNFNQVEALKLNKNYDADAIDRLLTRSALRKRGENARSNAQFTTDEERIDSTEGKYNLMHFYCKSKGMYVVTDDGFNEAIRSGVNPYPHGGLPISPLVDHRNLYSIYGYGECELLESTKYERNEIRNQIMDGGRISNTMNLLLGQDVHFQDNETIGGIMNVWNVEGDSNQAKFLQSPGLNSAIFKIDEILQTDATWITGIDNNALAGNPTKTAFEARLQEQTKLKGIGMALREFDYWLNIMGRQRLANIQFFLPSTTGRKIIGEQNAKKFRSIAVQDVTQSPLMGIDKQGKAVSKGIEVKKQEGNTEFFELTPDAIMSNLDFRAETPTTTPILHDIQRSEIKDFISTLLVNYQVPEVAAELKKIQWGKLIKGEFQEAGYDPNEYFDDGTAEAKQKEAIQSIMSSLPKPTIPMGQPQGQDQALSSIMAARPQPAQPTAQPQGLLTPQ